MSWERENNNATRINRCMCIGIEDGFSFLVCEFLSLFLFLCFSLTLWVRRKSLLIHSLLFLLPLVKSMFEEVFQRGMCAISVAMDRIIIINIIHAKEIEFGNRNCCQLNACVGQWIDAGVAAVFKQCSRRVKSDKLKILRNGIEFADDEDEGLLTVKPVKIIIIMIMTKQ